MIETNINGVAKLYHLLFHHFQHQGYGHLVGITSVSAVKGNRELPAYSASKAFQINYLEALRCKSIKENLNIVVTDICPGFVETPMNNEKKMFWSATTEKAAIQIHRAISLKKKKAFITKRWRLVYYIFKFLPNWLIEKF
jgi:short-subunit dehydrogenase